MAFTKEQQREHRKKLKANGMCTICHGNKADHSASVCSECWGKQMARRKARVEGGEQCKYCTRPRSVGLICRVCADSSNASRNRKKDKWAEEGLCYNCGGMKDDPSKATCINCQDVRAYHKSVARSWM